MKKYRVFVDVTYSVSIDVEAESDDQAQEYAEEKVGNDPYFWIKRGAIADIHAYDYDDCDAE
jgi:hypothetical protein